MEFAFLSILFLATIAVSVTFKRKFKDRENEKLLAEIEKDFVEEYNINKNNPFEDSSTMEGLIEWIEDQQLEDEIKKKS
tara:strand:+ start:62 stop:298 length:237 start_codon:yes stop_codon:yes gene_type:complete